MTETSGLNAPSFMYLNGDDSDSTVDINIKTLDGQTYSFHVNEDMFVADLKQLIWNKTGVPLRQQRLLYGGRVLRDDEFLFDLNLEDGVVMHLVEREPVESQPEPSASAASTPSSMGSQGLHLGAEAISSHAIIGTEGDDPAGAEAISSHTIIGTEGDDPAGGSQIPLDQDLSYLPFEPMQASELENLIEPEPARYDALTTIFDNIDRLEDVFQMRYNPWRDTQRVGRWTGTVAEFWHSEDFSTVPTPEFFTFVLGRTNRLLTNDTSWALRNLAERLENSTGSSDPVLRIQAQFAARQLGVALQHLGAMILELGRAATCLHMGDSPEQGFVICGPAVYITQDGPIPMIFQHFQPGYPFEMGNQMRVEQYEPIVSTSQAHDIMTSTGGQTHEQTLPPETPIGPYSIPTIGAQSTTRIGQIQSLCNVMQYSSGTTEGLHNAIMIGDTQPEMVNSNFTSELRSQMPELGDQDDPLLGSWLRISSEEGSNSTKESESEEK
ncbi:uncharacterized protein LOC110020446 isoform X3 [Phalaenopsis equestris]|uniref:uncharacterized protein LOC110020446 isoform X3 n=1 Tax=Phalaenopsis equestris TaxID=78828 RepID=UPI0009E5BA2B|nr:uncharacterized protein LOC110020446 isoform X3 [Phalaenopsis equestris]